MQAPLLAREEENPAKESKQAMVALSHEVRRMVMKTQSSSDRPVAHQ